MLMGQQLVQQLVKLLDIFSHQSGLSNMIEGFFNLVPLVLVVCSPILLVVFFCHAQI
jgi:hypothetical protein